MNSGSMLELYGIRSNSIHLMQIRISMEIFSCTHTHFLRLKNT